MTFQMNQVTHFIDHSNVYGSDLNETMGLRTFVGGALNVTTRRGHHELPLLPPDENATTNCTLSKNLTGIEPPNDVKCFKAGAQSILFEDLISTDRLLFIILIDSCR